MLSDVSVINKPPQMKQIPEFDLEIDVTPQFINKFIAGKGALSDTDNFTVITDGTDTKLVIGYSSVNTNRVTIPVTTSRSSNIENVSFNANLFKEVLVANREHDDRISSQATSKYDCVVEHPEGNWLMNSRELQYVHEKYPEFMSNPKYPDED